MVALDAITVCVISSTSLAGAIGTVLDTIMGILTTSSFDNGMNMVDVPTFWQWIVNSAILLLRIWFDVTRKSTQ